MAKQQTPRNAHGAKLCAWCGSEIRQSGVGRSKDYCRRSCRQRAYEARKQREAIVAAVAAAVVRRDSSRVETRHPINPSRDETKSAGPDPAPIQAPVYSGPQPEEEASVLPSAWKAPAPPRRPLGGRRRAGMQASAMPLWREEGDKPEPETP